MGQCYRILAQTNQEKFSADERNKRGRRMENMTESQTENKFSERFELPKNEEKSLIRKSILSIFIVVFVLLISSAALSYYIYYSLQNKLNSVSSELQKTKDSISQLEAKNKSDLNRLDAITDELSMSRFEHNIESGIVTDNFYVQKASFAFDKTKGVVATIDINTQPSMRLKYKGQSSFDVPDRELKGMLDDISKKVADSYSNYFKGTGYATDKATYIITIQNYELGTYTNGQFKLKGE